MGTKTEPSVKYSFIRVQGYTDELAEIRELERQINKKYYKMSRKDCILLAFKKLLR